MNKDLYIYNIKTVIWILQFNICITWSLKDFFYFRRFIVQLCFIFILLCTGDLERTCLCACLEYWVKKTKYNKCVLDNQVMFYYVTPDTKNTEIEDEPSFFSPVLLDFGRRCQAVLDPDFFSSEGFMKLWSRSFRFSKKNSLF